MSAQVQEIARPETKELVSQEILYIARLNAQAFSGQDNPTALYERMVLNHPDMYRFYREIEAKDTAISAAMGMRRALVLGRSESVMPSNAKVGQAQKYADGLSAFLKSIKRFDFLKWEMLDAPAYGFSVAEIMWNSDGGRVWVDKIIGRPQELFRFNKINYPQTGDLLLAKTLGGEGFPVPQNKFMVATFRPRHGDRRGLPVLRSLFWASWFKRQLLRLHLGFAEKGPGTIAVQYPSSADPAEQKKAITAALSIATELCVAIPETFKIMPELLTTTRTRNLEDFKGFVDYWDAEMAREILGQTLTTHGSEGSRGSQGQASIHEKMMWAINKSDCMDVEDVVNEQLCEPWLLFTFGPDALTEPLKPKYLLEKDPPKDATEELDRIAAARNMVPVRKKDIYEAANLTQPDATDDVVEPPSLPAQILLPGV